MIRRALARLAWTALAIAFVITVTFVAVDAIPADPARAMLGPRATPELIAKVRAAYCMDDGLLVRYGCWLGALADGDLGHSYRTQQPVTALLRDRVGPSLELALAAIVLQLALGIPLGMLAARRRGRWPDRATTLVGLIAQSVPVFVTGVVALDALAYGLGWFPLSGRGDGGLASELHHLALPALALAAAGAAGYARAVRGELVDALASDYARTARAKGASEGRVLARHALRNALGPLVALVGIDLGTLIAGNVVVEVVFAWPGLGRELVLAILDLDLPVVIAVVMLSAVAIAIANLLADLALAWLDPRLRAR